MKRPVKRAFPRARRIEAAIRELVADMVLKGELKDPRLKPIVISGVEVSRDLQVATIYFTVLGERDQAVLAEQRKALGHAAGFIQRRLAHELELRRAPELRFLVDESFEQGSRIDELLRNL